jgi:hypothetical protein
VKIFSRRHEKLHYLNQKPIYMGFDDLLQMKAELTPTWRYRSRRATGHPQQ